MTITLPQMDRLNVALFQQVGISEFKTRKLESGATLVEGLRVFRSGTFKDSMGEQHTWESEQLAQMVSNFDMLREKGILPNVPVREGHRSFLGTGGTVVGYVSALRAVGGTNPTNGESVTFLEADFEMTDPTGLQKLQAGTYRARSSEVGLYETNDESFYWPVFQGFAFVDIPAVEGLYSKTATDTPYSVLSEETQVTGTPPTPSTPPVVQPPQPPTPPVSDHGAPPAQPQPLMVYGKPVADFAQVQQHITVLEAFESAAKEQGRKDFAAGLVRDNKITAAQLTGTDNNGIEAYCISLSDDQFEAYKTTWTNAPSLSVLSKHSGGTATSTEPGQTGDPANPAGDLDEQIEIQEQVVSKLSKTGMKPEQLKNTLAFQKLTELKNRRQAAA